MNISTDEFAQKIEYIKSAPKNNETLKLIVIRPNTDERQIKQSCRLSLTGGAESDHWAKGCWKSLEDGSPHPDVQISLMNDRVLETIADTDEQRALAGDNLCVDLDLSEQNLKTADRLAIGTVILEITDVPHNGCQKFKERFGPEALAYINSDHG